MASYKKGAKKRGAWIVFQDESGVSVIPSVRATWAPKGKTPVLVHRFSWKRMSMSAAIAYRPDGSEASLIFDTLAGAYNDETLIAFLEDLHELLNGDKVTLVWDGLPSHRSKKMKHWINKQRHWLVVEQLPPYGHDLNPVEQIWGNAKGTDLANLYVDTIAEVSDIANQALIRIGTDNQLCFSFLEHCGLSL